MESLKHLLRGALVTSAVLCLVAFGVAQEQNSQGNSSNGSQSGSSPSMSSKGSSSSTTGASSAGSSGSKLSASDEHFVKKAAEGGMAEVELGQLAQQKAESSDVKQFAQRMVDDHSKANDQLKQLAQQNGVTLPTSLSAKDQADKDRLSKLSGEQFDKAYMHHMVMDHKKDVAEFKKESTSAQDPSVKSFASQTLPTLQSHLQEAQRVWGQEKSEAGSGKTSGTKKSSQSTGGDQP